MNIIEILGHLGADPETRFTPNGQKVTVLRVATNVWRKGKDETVWYKVTIWGDRFDKLLPHLKKGSAVIVIGELGKPEIYQDKEGRSQISLEVTAEVIRFSPFGRGEREKSGQENKQEQLQGQYTTGQYTTGPAAGSFASAPAAPAAMGAGIFDANDDDGLPF